MGQSSRINTDGAELRLWWWLRPVLVPNYEGDLMLETTVSEAIATTNQSTLVAVAKDSIPLHRVQLQEFLRKLKGRFVGVDFVKQDGSPRMLNGRLGVHQHLQGGDNKVEADHRPYLTIFDVQSGGYRTLNLATVSGLRADNKTYAIVG